MYVRSKDASGGTVAAQDSERGSMAGSGRAERETFSERSHVLSPTLLPWQAQCTGDGSQ